MIVAYILVALVTDDGGSSGREQYHLHHIEFNSREACENAKPVVKRMMPRAIDTECVPKG